MDVTTRSIENRHVEFIQALAYVAKTVTRAFTPKGEWTKAMKLIDDTGTRMVCESYLDKNCKHEGNEKIFRHTFQENEEFLFCKACASKALALKSGAFTSYKIVKIFG